MSLAATPRLALRQARAAHLVLRFWQIALVSGLMLLAAHDLGAVNWGSGHFFDRWLYEGLEAAAAVGCLTRAVRVRHERAAWLALGIALALDDLRRRDLRLRLRRESAVPIRRRRRATSASTRRVTSASCCSFERGSRASTQASGSTG